MAFFKSKKFRMKIKEIIFRLASKFTVVRLANGNKITFQNPLKYSLHFCSDGEKQFH